MDVNAFWKLESHNYDISDMAPSLRQFISLSAAMFA